MKKICLLLALLICVGIIFGCHPKEKTNTIEKPELEQIRLICELATMECYYHNVAKSVKKADSGITHLGEKDRTFWIEYTGTVNLGIDMSKVQMQLNDNTVTVTIPKAKILDIGIDQTTLNEDSYIASGDGWNKNKITAQDQNEAIRVAQKNMEKTVLENQTLLTNAQKRAKELIENYINQLGSISNIEYTIKWVEIEDVDELVIENKE